MRQSMLLLPETFVCMSQDEMMYLEGGAKEYTHETWLSPEDCYALHGKLGMGYDIIAAANEVLMHPAAQVVAAAVMAGLVIGQTVLATAMAKGGINIYSTPSTGGTVNPIPERKAYMYTFGPDESR